MKKIILLCTAFFCCSQLSMFSVQAQTLYRTTSNGGDKGEGIINKSIPAIRTTEVCKSNSLHFDGSNDYISVGSWFNEQVFTIEFWINPASTQNTYAMIVDNNHSGGIRWNAQQQGINTNTYAFGVGLNGGDAGLTFTLTANVWQHVALVKASDFIAVYINGIQVNYTSCSGTINGSGSDFIRIGQWAGGGRAWKGYLDEIRFWNDVRTPSEISNNMNSVTINPASETNLVAYYRCDQGIADGNNAGLTAVTDLSAYNHTATLVNFGLNGNTSNWVSSSPLTSSPNTYYIDADADSFGNAAVKILSCTRPSGFVSDSTDCNDANANIHPGATEICNNGVDDNCDGLIDAYPHSASLPSGLKLYLPFSGNANDASGSGHNGTVYNASLTTDRLGNANSAYSFNGTNTRIEIPDHADFHPTDITIAGWFNIVGSNGQQWQALISKTLGTTQYNSFVPVYDFSNSQIGTFICNNGNCATVFSPLSINTGWFHYAITFDDAANQLKLYINGTLVNTTNTSLNLFYDNSPLTIGCEYNDNIQTFFVNGKIDEVMIFNRSLTAAEITQIFSATGSSEICNGIDDNCNGQIDEGVGTIYYADADNDGYGNIAHDTTACTQPTGFVSNSTDCNDASATIHPDATEISDNNIDENCNGLTDEDSAAPTVSITTPANNASYTAPAKIKINAVALDEDGTITKVEFYNGNNLLHKETEAPYDCIITDATVGHYSITAKATDNDGNITTSVVVNIFVVPDVVPTVNITSPVNSTSYPAPANIILSALANDVDGRITKVEFYNGNTLLFTETAAPYYRKWFHVPVGNYSITARATDNKGAVTTSTAVNISVVADIAPLVSITSPANGANYAEPATIELSADASDIDGIVRTVDFYNGNTLLFTEKYLPYSNTWLNVPGGNYSITAIATDNNGKTTTSAPVTISVGQVAKLMATTGKLNFSNRPLSLNINPNPVAKTLNISIDGLPTNSMSAISVLSVSGVVIKTIQPNALNKKIQLDISSLSAGVYYIKLINGDKVLYKQFVKL